jgi:hypothetical protein
VRELVMVIPDLFLSPGAHEGGAAVHFRDVPGIEALARFGERQALPGGWRAWVAAHLGCPDLTDRAPAWVAAARLAQGPAPAAGASWIATPVHLSAGLTRVHLHHAGLLQLPAGELAALAEGFRHTWGGDGLTLQPLPCGELLLGTPAIAALETLEPARAAGGVVSQVLPDSRAAAPLRRFMAECEMWLHGQAVNLERARRGAPVVTALWPWGAMGKPLLPPKRTPGGLPAAFGQDAWLDGLLALCGAQLRDLPHGLVDVLAAVATCGALLLLRVAQEVHGGGEETVTAAFARLDARYISPALRALSQRQCAALTLILNDHSIRLRRGGRLRLWRRPRPGLSGFA